MTADEVAEELREILNRKQDAGARLLGLVVIIDGKGIASFTSAGCQHMARLLRKGAEAAFRDLPMCEHDRVGGGGN